MPISAHRVKVCDRDLYPAAKGFSGLNENTSFLSQFISIRDLMPKPDLSGNEV